MPPRTIADTALPLRLAELVTTHVTATASGEGSGRRLAQAATAFVGVAVGDGRTVGEDELLATAAEADDEALTLPL